MPYLTALFFTIARVAPSVKVFYITDTTVTDFCSKTLLLLIMKVSSQDRMWEPFSKHVASNAASLASV